MTAFDQVRSRWRSEHGQALVMALLIAVVGMLVVLGGVALALQTTGQASHDERIRGAQQAADAGVQQQIYLNSDSNGVGYNVTSGSIGSLLDCVLPAVNVNGQISSVSLVADTAGSCPQPTCPSGGASCTSGLSSAWTPLGAGDYYESRFLANPHAQASASGQLSYDVEFPQIVSIGCHSASASCSTVSGSNSYSRQLMVLQPTAPLQSIEAQNNVTIAGGGSALASAFSALGLGGLCSILNILCPTLPITAVAGNVTAGHNISLPAVTVGGNLNLASYLSLSGLVTLVTNLNNLGATLQYANSCSQNGDTCAVGAQTSPNTASLLNANLVHATAGTCTAGQPPASGACTLDRPTFTVSTAPTTATSGVPSGGTCTSCTISDTNGDLVMSAGTLNLSAGTYVFCNVNVTGGTFEGPKAGTTGAVQIFVLPYGASQCPTPSGNNQGNFSVTPGVSNLLSSTSLLPLDGVSGVVDPSAVQIYVSGDAADNSMAVGGGSTPHTSVTIGGAGISVEQAFVVYAPRSNVTITTSGIFEGSAIGWNVSMTAAAIVEDLDLGNYPLSSVINNLQPAQTVECNSNEDQTLSYTSSDLNGC
jgi:hypothetical protein